MKRIAAVIILVLVALYVADYLSVRFRHQPFGVVRVQVYYAVPKKNGTPDFYFGQPHNETCVHSLLPHFGDPPCWYLKGKKEKRVNE
jgi:hypothetical protein